MVLTTREAEIAPQGDAVSSTSGTLAVGPELQHEIEQFLFLEARCLDERRFPQWWEMFTDDVHYWMPVRYNRQHRELDLEVGGPDEVATFDEDKQSLYQRVYRLGTPTAWAEDPPSRTRHLISNVWVRPAEEEGELLVQSAFLIYRNRGDHDVDIFAGVRDDVLRPAGESWQIARRRILLDQATILAQSLSIFF